MYLGRFVERHGAERWFGEPRHPYTRALLASVLTPEPGLGIPETGLGEAMPDPADARPAAAFIRAALCHRGVPDPSAGGG